MAQVIDFLNTIFWGYVLIYGLLAVGLYFTIRLQLPADRAFRARCSASSSASPQTDKAGITPFQALCTSLASPRRHRQHRRRRGRAVLSAGRARSSGCGWWPSSAWRPPIAESTLAQLYKVHGRRTGSYRGGPAFYIARGLGLPWLGAVFSVCLILSFGLVFNAVQANSIADAMVGAFGVPKLVTGLALAALTARRHLRRHPQDRARSPSTSCPSWPAATCWWRSTCWSINIAEVPAMLGAHRRQRLRLRARRRAASPAASPRRC